MKEQKKVRIKKQLIFNLVSILFILSVGFYFLGRLIYYKIDSSKEIVYSSLLAEHLIEMDYNNIYHSSENLIKLNGIYRYVGDADSNYVRFKGMLWRVIKINADNSVTMVTQDTVTSLSYGGSLENYILSWLNETKEKNTGLFEHSLQATEGELKSTKVCTDKFSELETASCFETNDNYKIGILSIYDYIEANANESYLNNGEIFWTSNSYDNTNAWFVAEDGRLGYDNYTNKYGIRPVITIDGNLTIYSGDGSADNPYNLNNNTPKTLEDSYVGSYLNYNNTLWKIVSKEENKIKIVSEECLKDESGQCIEKYYSSYSNRINLKNKEDLMGYLNDTYYNSLENNEFIVEGKFYTGNYSLVNNDYKDCFDSTHNLYVGFLSAAELYAFELENTFLMTTSPNNDLSIYSVNSSHGLFENMVTEELNIRPSIYLKSNIAITSGDGSYLTPYQLGGIN